jgi:cytochrome c
MKRLVQTVFVIATSGWVGCGGGSAQQPSAASSPAGGASPHDHRAAEKEGDATGVAPDQSAKSEELAAYEKARPVFAAYCAACHTSKGAMAKPLTLEHFSMDSYPFGGHHASEITGMIRSVLGATGSKPTMPADKPGAVKGDELRLILSWADAADRARATGTDAKPHEHEHGSTPQKPQEHDQTTPPKSPPKHEHSGQQKPHVHGAADHQH